MMSLDGTGVPMRETMTPANEVGVASPARKVTLWDNFLSYVGFLLLVVTVMLLMTFASFQFVSPGSNPYVDVVGFLVLPGFLIIGLTLVPLGMLFRYRRARREEPERGVTSRLRLDLEDPRHRRRLVVFLAITFVVVLPLVGLSSYHGYHYTDSTEFCAKVCHVVMEPQAVAFERSPHARVACAECHIGPGADWFVKSKLSGTRQVFRTMLDSFSRPIPPAITELRPARETCEHCHWPAKFFGSQLRTIVRYAADETNTRREVLMLVRTGGADPHSGRAEGIHQHMALAGAVEYVATDEALQRIPWVKYTDADGNARVYRSDGKHAAEPPPEGILRQVDCMDCHNRAAHLFRSPQHAVDQALEAGLLDREIPFIKREAVAAMSEPYPDRLAAEAGIRERLTGFYSGPRAGALREGQAPAEPPPTARLVSQTEEGPRVRLSPEALAAVVDRVVDLYRQNFFPEMRVNWQTYPDNIGHRESAGCMRCHDGEHVADDGSRISSDCATCHTFLNRKGDDPATFVQGEFQHPIPLAPHSHLRCEQCHSGGPLLSCTECHESGEWLDTRGKGAFEHTHKEQSDQRPVVNPGGSP
jgi:nitrate/TMAO reductase-like tetraheme cytochrome c subunit